MIVLLIFLRYLIFRNFKFINFRLSDLTSLSRIDGSFIRLIIFILICKYYIYWILIVMIFILLIFLNQIKNLLWNSDDASSSVIWQSNRSRSITRASLLLTRCLFPVIVIKMCPCSSGKRRLWCCENTLGSKHYFGIVIELIYLLRCMFLYLLFWY
jgi:hypothetical protein